MAENSTAPAGSAGADPSPGADAPDNRSGVEILTEAIKKSEAAQPEKNVFSNREREHMARVRKILKEKAAAQEPVSKLFAAQRAEEDAQTAEADSADHTASLEEEGPAENPAEEESAEEAQGLEAPESWREDEKELFYQLPEELRQAVNTHEAKRVLQLGAARKAALRARQKENQATEALSLVVQLNADSAGHRIQTLAAAMKKACQDNDLKSYSALQNLLLGERKRQESLRALVTASQAEQKRHEYLCDMQRLGATYLDAMPDLQKLFGKKEAPAALAARLQDYLTANEAPVEHLSGITHKYQLLMIAKAMLYDLQEQARQSASKKIARAPRVQSGKARLAGSEDLSDLDSKAAAHVRRNGDLQSLTEALQMIGF